MQALTVRDEKIILAYYLKSKLTVYKLSEV